MHAHVEQLTQVVTFVTYIPEMSVRISARTPNNLTFSWFSSVIPRNFGIEPLIGYDPFFPHSLKFIIH
jgi:hypothetical protein